MQKVYLALFCLLYSATRGYQENYEEVVRIAIYLVLYFDKKAQINYYKRAYIRRFIKGLNTN